MCNSDQRTRRHCSGVEIYVNNLRVQQSPHTILKRFPIKKFFLLVLRPQAICEYIQSRVHIVYIFESLGYHYVRQYRSVYYIIVFLYINNIIGIPIISIIYSLYCVYITWKPYTDQSDLLCVHCTVTYKYNRILPCFA